MKQLLIDKMNFFTTLILDANVRPELSLKKFTEDDLTLECRWFDNQSNNIAITVYDFDDPELAREKLHAIKYILQRCKTMRGVRARIERIHC
jgi:hypothetical protein